MVVCSVSKKANGERRAAVGTGAVEGSLGEEMNESVMSTDRFQVKTLEVTEMQIGNGKVATH